MQVTGRDMDAIVAAIRAGQTQAFARVVRAYQEQVWRIVALTLEDLATTEDLVQQVFVRAYLALDRYEPGRDPGPWLRTIARNLVREELRRRAREQRRLEAYRDHLEATMADAEEADGRDEALHRALAHCRDQLSPDAQQALSLRYAATAGFDQIAGELGRTVAAARQLLQRARLALRDCIEQRMAGA